MKIITVISDNIELLTNFAAIAAERLKGRAIQYRCSENNAAVIARFPGIVATNLKTEWKTVADVSDLVISLHCKQLFPTGLVDSCRCINIHPGLNPFNRGWYPQVFSILNQLPLGATIHEIDHELDHGRVIAQEQVPLYPWDTSLSAYERVQQAELRLIAANLAAIVDSTCSPQAAGEEGNLNLKKDFRALCRLDREQTGTFGEFIDRLRALTHPPHWNAYFVDEKGEKVFVRIEIRRETSPA